MFSKYNTLFRFIFYQLLLVSISLAEREFPKGFLFGAGTSAYQIEGAWNVDGKGPNIWDAALHNDPSHIPDRNNGDITCNSYYYFDKDLKVMKELGISVYRFSMSWSRILPNGDISSLNQAGVDYYNMVLNKLRENNIEPFVTMLHMDLPEELQKIGGATNHKFINYFVNYADVLFQLFGDRVTNWITINQPQIFCVYSYGTATLAPYVNASDIGGEYLCGHNVLKAHTRAYELYKERYSTTFSGKVGISLNHIVIYMKIGDNITIDRVATQYYLGWFAHPLLSEEGDYPEVMRLEIAEHSILEGRARSRLPNFSPDWIERMKGSCDFIGINYYSSLLGVPMNKPYNMEHPSFDQDVGLTFLSIPKSSKSACWITPYPRGLSDSLRWIKENYNNIDTFITENGICNDGSVEDDERIDFIKVHLEEVLNAIDYGCRVKGYNYWSMIDVFEWMAGFSKRFGLFKVDFNSTEKTRSIRKSGRFYKDIIKNRRL